MGDDVKKNAVNDVQGSKLHYRRLFEKNHQPMLIHGQGRLRRSAMNDAFQEHSGKVGRQVTIEAVRPMGVFRAIFSELPSGR